MTISYTLCFGLVLKAFMVFGIVQQTHSFTWTKQPENPTYVVEGVSSSAVRLTWSWLLSNEESISTIVVTREGPKESGDAPTGNPSTIASRTADSPLEVLTGFVNDYRIEDAGTLVINKVTKADEDTIYNFVPTYINGAGVAIGAKSSTVIKVLVPPKITVFPKEKTEQDLETNFTLTCNATGDPQPDITWTKDDIPVRTFNVSGPVLHLVNVQRKDAGVYKCTAFNGYGSNATAVGVLSIKYDPSTRKQWIHAIRRDVGKDFSILQGTRVCSRDSKPEHWKKSLNGRITPKPGAVPSIFAWKRSSPRKRPPATPRFTATTVRNNLASECSEVMHSTTEFNEVTCNNSSSINMADGTSFPETAEIPQTPDQKEHKNIIITELQEKVSAALFKTEELESLVLQLKEKNCGYGTEKRATRGTDVFIKKHLIK